MAAGLLFSPSDDESSVELSAFAKENGVKVALEKYSSYTGKYVVLIEQLYSMLSNGKGLKEVIKFCDEKGNAEIRV